LKKTFQFSKEKLSMKFGKCVFSRLSYAGQNRALGTFWRSCFKS
jgi:hypothetical protein